jgi:hypothetical protein
VQSNSEHERQKIKTGVEKELGGRLVEKKGGGHRSQVRTLLVNVEGRCSNRWRPQVWLCAMTQEMAAIDLRCFASASLSVL